MAETDRPQGITRTSPRRGCPTRRLAGWTPRSTAEWPGRVSVSVLVGGCSCKCPFCDSVLHDAPGTDSVWEDLLGHLARERSSIKGVVVTGGEPLEDPDLPSLLARLCDRGWPIRLHTNGADPAALRYLVAEQLVTSVALDVKTTFDRYDALTGVPGMGERVRESVSAAMLVPDHEFRTTLFPGALVLDELETIACDLSGGRLWALQQYRPTRTLDPRAVGVDPYAPAAVREAARACRAHVPTIMRGFEAA